ncbi:MAG: ankyrin repeat domain-containing protein [Candidatus Parcubacteria bacterium]|nr:ankyrin repeat domain-containing protein [Candidatus Parcubacteria bacterium]
MTETCKCPHFAPATHILHMAARAGLSKVIVAALEEGADIKAREYDERCPDSGYDALALAVYFGHLKAVRVLTSFGADHDVLVEKGATLLIIAACVGHTEIGEYLISLGVPIDVVDGDGDSAMSVAKKGDHKEFIAMLEKYRK